jgi:hypothetical protein
MSNSSHFTRVVDSRISVIFTRADAEFDAARDQVLWLTSVLMVLTAAVAALGSADVGGLNWPWSILAVAFPALSTALSAYNAFYAFERQGKIYGDAANALLRARADSPDLNPPMDDAVFEKALGAHVEQVEQICAMNRPNGDS